jgi:predicted GNAT superfamily acetyltransferase
MHFENVRVRELTSWPDMFAVEKLQETIWGYGIPGNAFPYPARALFEFVESGGTVGGAFIDDRLIGMSFAWLGRLRESENQVYLHSQLVGVIQQFRAAGVGEKLKRQQMQFALSNGIDLIRWTFDPIKTKNANLNIKKLRGIVRRYLPNYYGNLTGSQNKGLPTDRFQVEWFVKSSFVDNTDSVGRFDLRTINSLSVDEAGNQVLTSFENNLTEPDLSFEVPLGLEEDVAKEDQFERVRQWQDGIRNCLTNYFEKGYILRDFMKLSDDRGAYILTRTTLDELLG